jgi:predicted ribosome quality control (RQC) complex YloA/Tae2 family protein
MVYYFSSNTVTPSAFIYVGKDKVENEELIRHGWEEDVWFHVDNLSSAHIYVRLPEGESWDKISEPLLTDCAQLTKANSIEGKWYLCLRNELGKELGHILPSFDLST